MIQNKLIRIQGEQLKIDKSIGIIYRSLKTIQRHVDSEKGLFGQYDSSLEEEAYDKFEEVKATLVYLNENITREKLLEFIKWHNKQNNES